MNVAGQSMKVSLCDCIAINMCINTSDTVSNSPYSSLANSCLFCKMSSPAFLPFTFVYVTNVMALVYTVNTGSMSAWPMTCLRALIACMCLHCST